MPRIDTYIWRARIVPAVLAAIPLLTFVVFVADSPIAGLLTPAVGLGAILLGASEWVRGRGMNTERRLKKVWDGMPTTIALRHRGQHDFGWTSRREAVGRLAGISLPTSREEASRPDEAEARYERAIHAVIAKLRSTSPAHALLASENASYGFRRNMRGIKVPAVLVLLLATVGHVLLGSTANDGWSTGLFVLAVDLAAWMYWLFVVRDQWVREQADKFTEQLFVDVTVAESPATKAQ